MNRTLSKALDAHGGLDKWRNFSTLSADVENDGALWTIKNQTEYTAHPVKLDIDLRRQKTSHTNFVEPGVQTEITPDLVLIKDAGGEITERLENPRASFAAHVFETPWNRPQLAYFTGYAMWSYLTAPFLLAENGFEIEDIASWFENGEEWRGIQVTFPESLAYHSKKQNFYFDAEGLLRRHDYDVEIVPGARGAHYMSDYSEVQGIKFPQKHLIRVPGENNVPMDEPIIVAVEISNIKLI